MLAKRREFRVNASLSPEAFQNQKLAKFRTLAAYAAKHSPWYRDIINERGIDLSSCVPEDFPVLTKSILMDN
jgi:phenylacetate-coenzyme A ligase PaaK-like adenylate-forming protein